MSEGDLRSALEGGPLAERFDLLAEPFLALRAKDEALRLLDPPRRRGLARVLATRAEAGRYLAHRPAWLERLAGAHQHALEEHAGALASELPPPDTDLESYLDALRLLRRDETLFAACFDLGELCDFEQASLFLSRVAEACLASALEHAARTRGAESGLAVLGMGKIAGRELTYESDLDMIFLHAEPAAEAAARTAARSISYLSTMTGAGVAYAVDSRLRPSGRQGTLVSSFSAFADYQRRRAATWEHLALLRSRAIAGAIPQGQTVLEEIRAAVVLRSESPWAEVAAMRTRVERERGGENRARAAYKTGPGGLMDVEFMATAGLLERGRVLAPATLPSIAAMLREAAPGPPVERLIERYRWLRRVESRNRWVAARAAETLAFGGPNAVAVAELVEPGLDPTGLAVRVRETRAAIRRSWDQVIAAGSIGALA